MKTLSRKTVREIASIVLSAGVAALAALCWPPERNLPLLDPVLRPIQRVEWWGYDALFHWRGALPAKIDPRIAVVGYSYNTEGKDQLETGKEVPWPPPRRFHAGLIDRLKADGAKVIVFDVLMHSPSLYGPDDDRALDAALNHAGNCVIACRIDRDDHEKREQVVAPYYDDKLGIDFERNATDAFVDIPTDADEIVRRVYPLQKIQGEWLPSLSAAAFLKLTEKKLEGSRETPEAIIVGGEAFPRTGATITDPANPENTLGTSYIDFPAGLSTFGGNFLPYEKVYRGEFPKGTFTGKAVFIGVSGVELTSAQNDKFKTAYSNFTPEEIGGQVTRDVYGVVVQAQMLNALLQGMFIRQAEPYQIFLLVFLISSLGTAAVRGSMNWRGPVLLVASVLGYIGLAYVLFVRGHMYVPFVIPSVLLLGSAAGIAWFERGQMRKMWAGYVSPAYMEVMLREGFEAKPRRIEEATVIFGDIRGFTKFSEQHPPEMVVRLLDKHLEKLVLIVYEQVGTVDKFLGDGILIVFGAPKPQPDSAVRAVRSAWRMREAAAVAVVDDDGKEYPFATGFGITTGALMSGHVGSKHLSSFTLIGDTVNLASRLQAITGEPDVVIDSATLEKVRDYVTVEFLGEKVVKGKEQPVPCYKVIGWTER
jgi:adenylate cyclase